MKTDNNTLELLEWPAIIAELTSCCYTNAGISYLKNELKEHSPAEARTQYAKIGNLKRLAELNISANLSGINDIRESLGIISKNGIIELEKLADIRNFVIASRRIASFFQTHSEHLTALSDEMTRLDPLKSLFEKLTPALLDSGEINEDHFPELKKLKNSYHQQRQIIEKKIHSFIHNADNEKLLQEKIVTSAQGRFCVLLKTENKNKVKGKILDISASGSTLYFEPDFVLGLNEKLLETENDIALSIHRIIRELSSFIAGYNCELEGNYLILAYLDFLYAAVKFAERIRGGLPQISDRPLINLFQLHHPLLYIREGNKVVNNDLQLGESFRSLVISGVNTGGKTVLLKSAGLAVLLAAYGLPVPASSDSIIGTFDTVMADIGDDQNLSQSLSTFSGQIVKMREMLLHASPSSFFLIDEIIVGTNPRFGAALARSILEGLCEKGALSIATTHYPELKEMAAGNPQFQNASVSFDPEKLKPTYKLNTGLPGVSFTLEIASIYGLPPETIERARDLIDNSTLNVEALLEKIQQYEERLHIEEDEIKKLQQNLIKEEDHCRNMQYKLDKLTREVKSERGLEFLDELQSYRRQVADRIKELQNKSLSECGKTQEEIISIQEKITGKLRDEDERFSRNTFREFNPAEICAGDIVYIVPLQQEATVEELDVKNRKALLLIGNRLKSRYSFDQLKIPVEGIKKARKPVPKANPDKMIPEPEFIPLTIQTSYNTIDLRGLRVDEGLTKLQRDLDTMTGKSIKSVVIIHGHGTGAMKEGVRKNLPLIPYVKAFRSGELGEGGDGVTIAQLF